MQRLPRASVLGSIEVAYGEPRAAPSQQEAGCAGEAKSELNSKFMTDLQLPLVIDSIGKAYGLTPAEARVLRAVVEIGGISDISAALSISPTTVKTHLRHIFQKTCLKGQVDLIRLVALTATCSDK